MRSLLWAFSLSAMIAAFAVSVHAQQRGPINAPNIKGTGETVPNAGAVAAEGVDKTITRRTPQERRQDRITNGICRGC